MRVSNNFFPLQEPGFGEDGDEEFKDPEGDFWFHEFFFLNLHSNILISRVFLGDEDAGWDVDDDLELPPELEAQGKKAFWFHEFFFQIIYFCNILIWRVF